MKMGLSQKNKLENGGSKEEVVYKPTTLDYDTKKPELLTTDSTNTKSNSFLYIAACVANLIGLACGIGFGWTSPVIPKLNGSLGKEHNPLSYSISPSEESWLAGIVALGAAVGPLVSGKASSTIGRKPTLILSAIPLLAAFIIAAFAKNIYLFYISRILNGIVIGCVFSTLPIYIGEITEDHNRGTISCFFAVFMCTGILIPYAIGPYVSIKFFNIVCIVPIILFMVFFTLFIPESPHFLLTVGKNEKAEESLRKLRNKSDSAIQKELFEIKTSIDEANSSNGSFMDVFRSKGSLKGLRITIGLVLFQQFSGINVVLAYMQSIFNATGSSVPPDISVIIIGIVQLLCSVLTSVLVDRLGKRVLLLTSAVGSGLSLLCLGVYFYMKNNNYNVDSLSFIPIISLISYIAMFSCGFGPLVWALLGELFPSNLKSSASTITSVVNFCAGFVICYVFPHLIQIIGMAYSFLLFAAVCGLASIFIYLFVIETKGQTLYEIQQILNKN